MTHAADALIGDAAALAGLRGQIQHLASFDTVRNPHVPTVLLQGETGTGKGLVASVIHASGARAKGPFIDVNCAAIPETMVEAELFGFEAGAFTDARRAKPGLFEAASTGTLFLDEIDSLPLLLQSKLLKAIEEKSVRRLGAVAPRAVDVKLVAATQKDLKDLVAAGRFRADLYYRLALVILEIPPLRARREDVILLAEHFLGTHARAHGLPPKRLSEGARAWLLAHDWPGNVRELAHLMERVTLLAPGDDIERPTLEELSGGPTLRTRATIAGRSPAEEGRSRAEDASETEVSGEADRIRDALARSGGNVLGAARLLGLGRNALRYRMRRLGIERPRLDLGVSAAAERRASGGQGAGERRAGGVPGGAGPSWEQKPVAVLAIDLTLVEPDAGAPTPYEPWTLARRWEQMIQDRVRGFGGIFVARSPSRLTALFGIPRALEEMPQRAAQVAVAIQRLRHEAQPHREREPLPELRMALHLGSVQIDATAHDPIAHLRPVGDTLAAPERLLGHAGRGEILVSSVFARRIEDVCELRGRDLRIGGEEGEVLRAYAVVGQRPRQTPSERLAVTAQSSFVGRERELETLHAAFLSAAAGNGQVVFVVGEAGIGKSRLLAELRRMLRNESHLWVEGRYASYGTTAAFLPIVDGLRRFFGIDDRDDEASAHGKLERTIAGLGGDLDWTLPFVRQLLSLQARDDTVAALDSASRRSEIFRALKAITQRAAEGRPLVLVVEDLHWIDAASEEYLTFIADAIPTTRALLVCSHRTGYRHPFGERSYHVRVALRPLSPVDMATITGSVLGIGDVPADVRALIAGKAEGNPFFVEEVTKSLLEDGTLQRENGRIVLARDVADITIPGTIHDVLSARLDRLPDGSRRAIQVASVIGREFALRLLERITEAGERVRTQVDELRTLELIYEKATHPELAYMFKHALTHDVAYESVLLERRRTLHRTIGLAIEELYADRLAELYETLAHHFTRAEDWERAIAYHERAAAKAAENFANRAVIAHCREALAIAARLGERVSDERRRSLEEQQGLASFYVSEYAASADAFARAAARSAGVESRAINLANASFSAFWGHDYPRASRESDTALGLARRHDLPAAEARALHTTCYILVVCGGDIEGHEQVIAQALHAAERSGDEATLALTRFFLAQKAEWTGEYRRSLALSEQVIAAGRRLRLAHLVVWTAWFLGKAACCLGEYGRAIAHLTEAYEVCDRIGDRAWKSRMLNTLGWCFSEIGSHDRARGYNERAAALAHEIGDPEIVANSEINLGQNHLVLGDVARAAAHLEPVGEALAHPGDPWMRWRYSLHARDALGRLALARARPEEALTLAEGEYADATRHRVHKVAARAVALRGEALLMLERWEDAAAALREALEVAERIHYPRGAWAALGLLAEVSRRAGKLAEAARYVARQQTLVAGVARSVSDADTRQRLLASVAAPAQR